MPNPPIEELSAMIASAMATSFERGGSGISDRGISGFLPGRNRREVHATTQT